MIEKKPIRLKMEMFSFFWHNHEDHPLVGRVPDNFRNQVPNADQMGAITNGNQLTIIGPGTRLIETGGRVFPVDDNYYQMMYDEIVESKQEIMNATDAGVTQELPVGPPGPMGDTGVC